MPDPESKRKTPERRGMRGCLGEAEKRFRLAGFVRDIEECHLMSSLSSLLRFEAEVGAL